MTMDKKQGLFLLFEAYSSLGSFLNESESVPSKELIEYEKDVESILGRAMEIKARILNAKERIKVG